MDPIDAMETGLAEGTRVLPVGPFFDAGKAEFMGTAVDSSQFGGCGLVQTDRTCVCGGEGLLDGLGGVVGLLLFAVESCHLLAVIGAANPSGNSGIRGHPSSCVVRTAVCAAVIGGRGIVRGIQIVGI